MISAGGWWCGNWINELLDLPGHLLGCESHLAMPWDGPAACGCGGAGMPCPRLCNQPADDERPRLPAGFVTDVDIDLP
jgi:hypothetical protein